MSIDTKSTRTALSAAADAIFSPIIDHFTLPNYRYTGWLEAGREGISLPGRKMLVTASSAEGMRSDAGCITKQDYALDTGRVFLQWRVQSPEADTPVAGAHWGLVSSRSLDDPLGDPLVWKVWITMEAAAAVSPTPSWNIAVRKDGEWEEKSFHIAPCDGCFDADLTMEPNSIMLLFQLHFNDNRL